MSTNLRLLRLAGAAAIASGALFAVIQLIHPSDTLASVGTTAWMWAHVLSFLFPVLGIWGITGIYLAQAARVGVPGLVGYVGLVGAFVLMTCFAFYEAFVAPVLAVQAPGYVVEAMSILDGEAGPQYLGTLFQLNGALYLLGGLVFAVTTLRAGVLPRWASGTLLAGLVVNLAAALVPDLARPSGAVFGLGLVALGYALVRWTPTSSDEVSRTGPRAMAA